MMAGAASESAIDFLIVTALPEERDALLALLEPVQKIWQEGSPTYYRAEIPAYAQDGKYHVAVTMLNDMGNVEAAQHTTQAIHDLGPDYVLVVGIAGGVRGKVRLGDVIVARQVIYYEQAKLTPAGLDARPSAYPADPTLLDRAQNYMDLSWRDLIRASRPAKRGRKASQQEQSDTVFGVIATGEKVIADADVIAQLKRIHSKLVGVEMEAFGVAVAAANNRDRPRFMAIRGACDYADNTKDDRWHRYAAESAAAFTIGFLRSGPVVPRTARVERQVRDATLIAIRHQSMERFPDRAIVSSLPPELADYSIEESVVDQSDLFIDGRLIDPLQAAQRQGNLDQRLDELLSKHGDAKVAYYGIAHIPLLFLAGYSLSNKRAIHLFDFNRRSRVWNLLQLGGDIPTLKLSGLPARARRTKGDVVIRISISYEVTADAIAGVVSSPTASLHLHIEQPQLDIVTSEHQVQEYGRVFRSMLDGIHQKLPNATCLHLFYAGPPPVAFHFGQQISKTIHPRVIVYNYVAKDDPPYSWGLEVTASIDAPQFVVRSGRREE
jgi:nucleoside phosphorylase